MKEERREESLFKEDEDSLEETIEGLVDSVGYETICSKACTGEPVITFAVMYSSEDEIDDAIKTFLYSIENYRNGLKAIKHEGDCAIDWMCSDSKETTLYWRMKPTIERNEFKESEWIIRTRLLVSTARELNITDHGYIHAMRGIKVDSWPLITEGNISDNTKELREAGLAGYNPIAIAEEIERKLVDSGDINKIKKAADA